ncbi:hypothetical protein RZ584_001518 [Pseudomonas aeruginosa]|nr:hypothetical protein [Pseudomonas aeruginosa]EIU3354730.1 hypothetical protein [Pseudomonas aeruginosa]EIU3383088.1 hypothetical protein [Pseudomonas aeruginosa]EIU3515627.1 hypothetical protein [Pseudomonas aeruginosa]EIU3534326.1 hypothetical protein [Pseudomonas aeruginosa]
MNTPSSSTVADLGERQHALVDTWLAPSVWVGVKVYVHLRIVDSDQAPIVGM